MSAWGGDWGADDNEEDDEYQTGGVSNSLVTVALVFECGH